MKREQLAYIAGLVDGEGTVLIGRYPRKGNKHLGYRGYFSITNTNVPLLQSVQREIGGTIVRQGKLYKGEPHLCYNLSLTANAIRFWLPQLFPYLRAKRDQAEVLLTFLERQAKNASAPVSDELLAFYESCYQQLKSLKLKRYVYKKERVSLGFRDCQQCGKQFEVFSDHSSHKIYCSNWCKRKTHWTRSNHRIAEGRPAWEALQN